ncbi:hypothetical protein [Mycolicibacterium sp. A43C]
MAGVVCRLEVGCSVEDEVAGASLVEVEQPTVNPTNSGMSEAIRSAPGYFTILLTSICS